jgi:hypothetical protein
MDVSDDGELQRVGHSGDHSIAHAERMLRKVLNILDIFGFLKRPPPQD